MAKLAALMGAGAAFTAAGQGVDRHFQLQMEQMRQNSLQALEQRRLDLTERELAADTAYKNKVTGLMERDQFGKSADKFRERMDTKMTTLVEQLPVGKQRAAMSMILREVMRNMDGGEMMMGMMTDTADGKGGMELDPAKIGAFVTGMMGSMDTGGLTGAQAVDAVHTFAGGMVKEWGRLQKQYPDIAGDLTIADVITQMPGLVGSENNFMPRPEQQQQAFTGTVGPYPPPPPIDDTSTVVPPPPSRRPVGDSAWWEAPNMDAIKARAGQMWDSTVGAMFDPSRSQPPHYRPNIGGGAFSAGGAGVPVMAAPKDIYDPDYLRRMSDGSGGW